MSPDAITVDCAGAEHRVGVDGENLVPLDHEELDERALLALGAEPPPCVWLAHVWGGAHRDPSLLAELVIALAVPGGGRPRRRLDGPANVRDPALVRAGRASIDRVPALPAPLRADLCARICSEPGLLPAWTRDIAIAALSSCERFTGMTFRAPTYDVEASVIGHTGADVEMRLRASWLRQVMGRFLAVVDGTFVVDVLEPSRDGYWVSAVRTVGHDLVTERALVRRDGDRWTLRWT